MGNYHLRSNVSTAFESLPAASLVQIGTVKLCTPFVAGQPHYEVYSDGTNWRPRGGRQTIYKLLVDVISVPAQSTALQLISIPIPAKMLNYFPAGFMISMGAEKLGSIIESLSLNARFGPLNTVSDPAIESVTMTTTTICKGTQKVLKYTSVTTIRPVGLNIASASTFGGTSSGARTASITVGDLSTTTNYLGVYGTVTYATDQATGELNEFIVELLG